MNYRFKPHKMNDTAQVKANNMKVQASILLQDIEAIPDCREKNVAIERLEECVMWATKAIAMHQVQM